jgi:thiamine biosynthesis lipoprotein
MRPLLGTFVEIRLSGERSQLELAVSAAFEAIERVQQLMSFHTAQSDVARINAARVHESIRIDPETYTVLRAARALSVRSRGLFDVTVAPTLVRAGFLPRPTGSGALTTEGLRGASSHPTYRDLELLPNRKVRWRRKSWIDLGGIAKGYAVDRAVAVLRDWQVQSAVVNAGGDLRCFGAAQPIYLRSPHQPTMLLRVGELLDGAIATSAGYYRSQPLRGQRCVPLVHPRRARCISLQHSVSIAARTCMAADALTKVLALSPTCAPALLERCKAQAVIADLRGVRLCGRAWLRQPSEAVAA